MIPLLISILHLSVQYEQCYMKVMESPEYQKIVADVAKMTNEERLDQAEKRFVSEIQYVGIDH